MPDIKRGRVLAILAPVFWSITGIVVRLMEGASEWQINLYRSSALVLFVLVYLCVRYRGAVWQVIRAGGMTAVLAGFFLALAYVGNIVSLKHTTVANAMLLRAGAPIVAAILGWILLRERLNDSTVIAIALAFVGVAIMVGSGVVSGGLYGDLVALAGTVSFGFYAVTIRGRADIDMAPAVLYSGVYAAALGAVATVVAGDGLVPSAYDIALCVLLGVVQIGIGGLLFAAASRSVPVAQLTLFGLAEPVLASLWVWLGVGEVPAYTTFFGGAIILTAVVIQATDRSR